MKKIIIAGAFLLILISAKSYAQEENKELRDFIKKEKSEVLKAYAHKDIAGYRKNLDELLTRYNKLSDKEKRRYSFYVNEQYYLLADLYAKTGDKKNALAYLEQAKGHYDYDDLVNDHDLDKLRKEPGFIKLLAESKKPKYQAILQKSPKYNNNEKDKLPEFTYQSANDSNLVALKATYNLDSIAGNGDDLTKMINLMEWVHYLVPHDGSKGNPKNKNAMSFINEWKQNKKTLNCRGLGIILNEVYLAEGFKSRFVTCLPLDTTDQDCHVITMVWSTSLKKWVWMDPTFMAYVMDENGVLLSIEEVRGRLVNDKPLILNPDANRNHAVRQTKEDYLGYYMSKNLYKLECPVNSQYNYETPEEGKSRTYMQLLPGSTVPAPKIAQDKHGMPSYSLYYTNNPAVFWAAPSVEKEPEIVHKSETDYEKVMEQFKGYYNQQQADNIVNMFSNPEQMKGFMNSKMVDELMKDYGKLISFKFLGLEGDNKYEDVALFKMVCEKSVHVMGISIDKDNKLGTFRFETSSTYIDKLLAKEL